MILQQVIWLLFLDSYVLYCLVFRIVFYVFFFYLLLISCGFLVRQLLFLMPTTYLRENLNVFLPLHLDQVSSLIQIRPVTRHNCPCFFPFTIWSEAINKSTSQLFLDFRAYVYILYTFYLSLTILLLIHPCWIYPVFVMWI